MLVTAEDIVEQPASVVWELITNPLNFNALGIPDVFYPYESEEPEVGTEFESRPIGGTERWAIYVVQCEKNRIFSFGDAIDHWVYQFKLTGQGSHCLVEFVREFREKTELEKLFTIAEPDENMNIKITENTITALANACSGITNGVGHGLTRNPDDFA